MSIPYEQTGRSHQKARTRQALVEAARVLIAGGRVPSVEAVAAAAGVSRATAFRYFSSQNALLVAAHPFIEAVSLLDDAAPSDPVERLALVVAAHAQQILELEHQFRTMLRLSLDPSAEEHGHLLLRKGRAIAWIEDALAPLRDSMSDVDVHRVAVAIRSVEGVEAFVWLTDVAALSRPDAIAVMAWSAQALLGAVLNGDLPPAPSNIVASTRSAG
ncbi:MAG: TetR family transcriptional regulator [Candidatus Limnocylindrales bacterium]